MPVSGARPKPPGQAVTRHPRIEGVECANVPFKGRAMPRRRGKKRWPEGMVAKWRAWSTMPHCALWTETDWQFAVDALHVAARTVETASDSSWMTELRQRERVMGTTLDSRRALRIRYTETIVQPEKTAEEVARLDDYRNLA